MPNINDFKSRLRGGGARPNQFKVTLPFPGYAAVGGETSDLAFLCRATALPGQTIPSFDVPFRGRTFKVAGDRTIDVWSITVINDEDFALRKSFEAWSELIAKLDNNLGATDPSAYMVNARVFQLGRGSVPSSQSNSGDSNAVLAEYEFVDIFPTSVSQIDLSYDSSDAIEEFTVEFQVQSFNVIGSGTPNG